MGRETKNGTKKGRDDQKRQRGNVKVKEKEKGKGRVERVRERKGPMESKVSGVEWWREKGQSGGKEER